MSARRQRRNINNCRERMKEIQNAGKTVISGSLNNTKLWSEMVSM